MHYFDPATSIPVLCLILQHCHSYRNYNTHFSRGTYIITISFENMRSVYLSYDATGYHYYLWQTTLHIFMYPFLIYIHHWSWHEVYWLARGMSITATISLHIMACQNMKQNHLSQVSAFCSVIHSILNTIRLITPNSS